MISGYLFFQKQTSQLQRCLSAGIKYVLTVFSNFPTLILNTGVYQKLPAFKQSRQIQFFFIGQVLKCENYINYINQGIQMKKKQDFIEQMKNSQQFLSKLNGFKKASKQIKDKNKLISHRNIWVKQYKYLSRLQRDQDLQNINYFQIFDKYFCIEMEERQIFAKQSIKTFSEYLNNIEEENNHFQIKMWKDLKSLPLLINRITQANNKLNNNINTKDAKSIVNDISKFLQKQEKQINSQLDKIQRSQMTMSKAMIQEEQGQENDGQYDFLQDILAQHNFDDVRGFDFQANQLKRIEQGQSHLKQYIQSLSDKLSQDEISSVINQYHHASNLLNQTLQLQLQKITLDYQQALSLDNNMLSMSENYQIINHIYSTYLGRGKSVSLYNERLGIQFPKVNKKILQRMTEYIEGKNYKSRKTNAIKRNFLREKQQLLQKVQKQVNERIEEKIRKAQKQAERLQRKQQKIKLQKQLQQLRAQYQKRKSQKQKIIKDEQQKQKQEERKKQAIRRLYLDQLSKKAAEVHQVKQKKHKQEEELKKKQKIQEEIKIKKALQENKPKVQRRQSIQIHKIQKKVQQQKQRKEFPIKNQQRINKAIQKYAFRPVVQASQQRLVAPTEGLIKRRQTTLDMADKVELTKMTGYNINQLMGDRRFKLNTALFQAGLANTDYAREIINKMSRRPE